MRKGAKQHEMPAHHLLETYTDEYIDATGIEDDKPSPYSARPSAAPDG